jgi:hypothetical protein
MSARKKRVVVECEQCDGVVLTKDLAKHQSQFCGSDSLESDIQVILPKIGMVATTQSVEKRDQYLPPESFGWTKHNAVLVHPETLSMLGALPRAVCAIRLPDEQQMLATLWPCTEVAQLRLSHSSIPSERMVKVRLCNSNVQQHIALRSPLQLELFQTDYFLAFVKSYLSQAFIAASVPTKLRYFGTTFSFSLMEEIHKEIENLNLADSPPRKSDLKVIQIPHNAVISIVAFDEDQPEDLK